MSGKPLDGSPRYGGIYGIRRIETGDVYVGSAACIAKRWRQHRNVLIKNAHHSRYLQRAWNKYGEDAFEFVVLERVDDRTALIAAEQAHFDRLGPSYNALPVAGSSLGFKHSPETILKLRGNQNGLGFRFSPEQRRRLSEIQKARVPGPAQLAHIANLAKCRIGVRHTEDTKAKLRESQLGRKKPPRTEAHREALRQASLRFYAQRDG